jgi:hypothetical protein
VHRQGGDAPGVRGNGPSLPDDAGVHARHIRSSQDPTTRPN